jgi:uncharacterized protein (DUF58 family)
MNTLLEPREFRLLEGLRFNPRKSFTGKIRGERLTRKKGISIEFSDYRDYTEGDDLRHLDWNVLARLETATMKSYRDEEDLAVHVLVDYSPSMEFGEPVKQALASKLGIALGYVALAGGDAVYPRRLGIKESPLPPLRGRTSFVRLNSLYSATSPSAEDSSASLSGTLRAFAGSSARAGLMVLLSDGLDPALPTIIRILGGRGHEVCFLQILSDMELDPDLEGDLRLLDAETSGAVEITANSFALKAYRENLERHNQAIRDAVLRIGGRYALVRSSQSIESIIRDVVKRDGWVR